MNGEVLIVGVDGLIGSSLARRATDSGIAWMGTSRNPKPLAKNILKLDLLDADEIQCLDIRPRIAYLCAAQTDIRQCESDPVGTHLLNVEHTLLLARHLHEAGSEIVFLSSNLVFDGNEACPSPSTPFSPQTEYGRQKAEVEEMLRQNLTQIAIVRLTKVVHSHFPIFKQWLRTLGEGKPIHPFSDMFFCPIDLAQVVRELEFLSRSFQPGIFQLSGEADISYATAAGFLAKCRGFDPDLVQPQTTEQAGFQQHVPRHTALVFKPVTPSEKPEPVWATLERVFAELEV